MVNVYDKARKYILENGSDAQNKLFLFLMGEESKDAAVKAISSYQNEDGGWANGLEIEYQGNISSPMTTAAALGYICMFELQDASLYSKTLEYLSTVQKENGSWDESKEITKFNIPPHYVPGNSVVFVTGMIIKWLRRLNTESDEMLNKAVDFMLKNYESKDRKENFWTAVGYINAFSELSYTDKMPQIMEWAVGILTPPEGMNTPKNELPWPQVNGMIHDDDKMLMVLKEKVIKAIEKNQETDGGWPHQFGTYNRVWAAILIVRFLKSNNLI